MIYLLPLHWMSGGGIYDIRNNLNGGGDSLAKNPIGSFITGGFGEVIDAPTGTRISTAGGYSREPSAGQRGWKADPRLLRGYEEREAKEKKKKARARKWAKIRKAIKLLLHKIKEKLKE